MLETELYFGRNLLSSLPTIWPRWGRRAVIIADAAVASLVPGEVISVAPEKTAEAKERIERQLFEAGVGRDTVLIGVGGGSVTDLVGFIASTYMRGVPLILVPTTLLAMVDASIGGKTAIDTAFGKNLIGTFYLPKAIVTDLDLLKTLPEKEMINGRSEILKMGLIYDPTILELTGDEQIERAIQAKISVVKQDPKDLGLRKILNFGHTIGHAIESVSGLPHGQAVALGCVAESYLSMSMGFLSKHEFDLIASLFPKLSWNFDRGDMYQRMRLDKKGAFRFVLLRKIGEALAFDGQYCMQVPQEKLDEAISWMEKQYV